MSELKVHIGSVDKRLGDELERTILEPYKHVLAEKGIEVESREIYVQRC